MGIRFTQGANPQTLLIQQLQAEKAALESQLAELKQTNQRLLETVQSPQPHADLPQPNRAIAFQTFYETSPLLMGIVEISDDDILYISDNPATLEFFGLSDKPRTNQWASELGVSPSILEQWLSHYRQSQQQQKSVQFAYEHVTEAATYWLLVTVAYTGIALSGRPQFSYIAQDISERHRLEAEQRRVAAIELLVNKFSHELKLLASIPETMLGGYWDWNILDNQEYLSPGFKRMLGYTEQELPNSAGLWQQLIYPDDLSKALGGLDRHIQSHGQVPFSEEVRFQHKNGAIIWVICSGQVVEWGAADKPLHIVGCYVDITQRKTTEEALQQSEARWQFALEGPGDGVWDWNIQTNEVFFSHRWKAMLGYEDEDVSNHFNEWDSRVHPEDKAQCYQNLDEHFNHKTAIYHAEHRIRCKDGTYKWILARGKVMEWSSDGKPLRIIGIHTDISDRKRSEAEREETERKQQQLAQELVEWRDRYETGARASGQILFEYDIAADQDTWGPNTEEVLGYKVDALPEKIEDFIPLIHPDDQTAFRRILDLDKVSKIPYQVEFRIRKADGTYLWVEERGLTRYDADGKPAQVIGYLTDISDRKQTELTLKATKDQLELVLQASSEGFWDWDLVTGEIYFSPHWKEMLGYTDHELDNTLEMWESLIFEEDRIAALQLLDAYNSGGVDRFEATQRFHHKNGSTVYVLSRAIHLRDEHGNIIRMVGSHLDMTSTVAMQAALKTSEMQLSSVLDSSLDGIMAFRAVRDASGAIIDFEWLLSNPSACEIVERSPDELIGKRLLQELPGNRADGLFDLYVNVVESGEPVQQQFHYNHDGIESWFENAVVKLGDGFVATFRNITPLKQSEQALQQVNQQLEDRLDDLKQRHREMQLLGEISDFLQACLTVEEAYRAIASLVEPLFPDCTGGIFAIDESGSRADAIATWGQPLHSATEFHPTDCWALRRGRVHWAGQAQLGLRCNHITPPELSGVTLCSPMIAQGETLGLFYLSASTPDALPDAKQQLARTVAEQIALALANLRLYETLQYQSIRDPLTGLFNRRYLEETLNQEIQRAQRYHHPISVVMLDIDYFKRFNDIHGHDAGDQVLQAVGDLLKDCVRGSDIACRYGGEEMTLVLPNSSLEATCKRAEAIRVAISKLNVQHNGKLLNSLSVSLGVACFPTHGTTSTALVQAADAALYQAKSAGRNTVRVASKPY